MQWKKNSVYSNALKINMGVIMTVRIVPNFWKNVENNKDLILKCFKHHFKKHPDPDGEQASYNNLLVKMNEYGVFNRFDLERLVIAAGMEGVFSGIPLTESMVKSMGIDVEKKWEQFIFKWIEKILNEEYNRNGKISRTFRHGNKLFDYGIPRNNRTSWIDDPREAIAYEVKFNNYSKTDRRGRKFAPTFYERYIAGDEGFDDPCEAFSATELRKKILSRLNGTNDQAVFKLMEKDMTESAIAKELNLSTSYIGKVISKIRTVTSELCEISV
jgi:hypothetical protein